MSYEKTTWKNRLVERPRTFRLQQNADGSVTLIPAEGNIIEAGTPVNAENLNKIEQGIEDAYNMIAAHLAEYATLKNEVGTETLQTTNKTLKGAINEVFTLGNSRKSETVDMLLSVDDSLPITHDSSWDEILNAIGQISGSKKATGITTLSDETPFLVVDNLAFRPNLVLITGIDEPVLFIINENKFTIHGDEYFAIYVLRTSGIYEGQVVFGGFPSPNLSTYLTDNGFSAYVNYGEWRRGNKEWIALRIE